MRGSADAMIAAAGREAAGMSRRFARRYVDRRAARSLGAGSALVSRPFSQGATAFAARLAADKQIPLRTGGLRAEAIDLLGGTAGRVAGEAAPRRAPVGLPAPVTAGLHRPAHAQAVRPSSGRTTRPFRPVSFSPAAPPQAPTSPQPRTVLSTRTAAGLEPAFAAPPAIAEAARLMMRPGAGASGLGRRPDVTDQIPRPAEVAVAPVRRPGAGASPAEEAPQDYRRLGPTALRDTLRQRGGAGAAPDFALRERLRGPLQFDPAYARLHAGLAAADAARALNAQAFTIGRDVFFGQGRYEPTTGTGLELIAHELTHVGQQSRLGGDRMHFFTASGGDALEQEAQQTAARVAQRPPLNRVLGSGVPQQHPYQEPVMQLAKMAGGAFPSPSSAPAETYQAAPEPSQESAGNSPSPRAVADRVYDLMKKELAHGSRRGQTYGKG